MTDNDFPALRSAVRDSVIGHTVTKLTTSVARAASNASAARLIRSHVMTLRDVPASAAITLGAIAMMTACLTTWVLSLFVPLYVSTAIPGTALLVLAVVGGVAAAGADALADHWSRSRMRRVTAWLRGA